MNKFKHIAEQHREKGRFKPVVPQNVPSVGVGPRPEVDSANVKLKEARKSPAMRLVAAMNKEKEKADAHHRTGEEYMKQVRQRALEMEKQKKLKEEKDEREYDYEGEMVKSDLRSIIANANRLIDMLDDDDNLPEWCQNKITLAEDYVSTVANYMTAEMNEQIQEAEKHEETGPNSIAAMTYVDKPNKEKMHKMKEEVEQVDEANKPTNPGLWARAKSLARQKFDVYPSAYANGWAAKWYKSKGGGWRSVSESIDEEKKPEPPFKPDEPKKRSAVAGKHGVGYSTARHLARMAMKKQMKPAVKEEREPSSKLSMIKGLIKKKKQAASEDAFQKDPELSSTLTKNQ
jgi:hypothetical protein